MINSIFTDRFELKYICTISVAEKLKQRLSKFIAHDINQSYLNYSIYFDSPNFTFYREKQQGPDSKPFAKELFEENLYLILIDLLVFFTLVQALHEKL